MKAAIAELLETHSRTRRRRIDVRAWLAARRPRIRWRPSVEFGFDATLVAGLAAIAAGCGWIYPATAPIVGGVFLVVIGWVAGRPEPEKPAEATPSQTWFSDDGAQHPVDEDE